MLHATTAVADGLWTRIGSTNLNTGSWMNNWEMDVIIEDGHEDLVEQVAIRRARRHDHPYGVPSLRA